MRKIANQLYELEMVHQNPETSLTKKAEVEKEICKISNMLACLPNGMEVMEEIDIMLYEKMKKNS
jgi:hypothetical protein